MRKIERCPFCGEAAPVVNPGNMILRCVRHHVFCPGCFARGPESKTEAGAIWQWNSRLSEEGSDGCAT